MKTIVPIIMLLASTPATAQTPPAAAITAPVDPARLAEARLVVAKLLPPGVYKTVIGPAMTPFIDNIGDTMKSIPLRQMAEMGGLDAKQAAALDKVNLEQVMAIYDPHWRERTQLTMRAMLDSMANFFTSVEPELREAYAHAYASRFTLAELNDLDAFYRTPTGAKFAAQYLTIATDPAIGNAMRAITPKLMQQMPTFIAAAQKATASLPPPRKLKDLSPSEKAQLSKALGVPESQLRDPKSPT